MSTGPFEVQIRRAITAGIQHGWTPQEVIEHLRQELATLSQEIHLRLTLYEAELDALAAVYAERDNP